jgi:hypothetical protein
MANLLFLSAESRAPIIEILKQLTTINQLWKTDILTEMDDLEFKSPCESHQLDEIQSDHLKMTHIRVSDRFMKEKKKYEVDQMSLWVAKICRNLKLSQVTFKLPERSSVDLLGLNCFQIVDIGCGRGYLSTQLSSVYKHSVIGIDSSPNNVTSSLKRVVIMKKQSRLKLDSDNFRTFSEFIRADTDLNKLVKNHLNINLDGSNYAIVGLHSCGNLSSSMIDIYLKNQAHLLFNVACCYHLIGEKYAPDEFRYTNEDDAERTESDRMNTFPMSSQLNEIKYFLGRNALMMSTIPVDRYLFNNHVISRTYFILSIQNIFHPSSFPFRSTILAFGIDQFCRSF